MIEKRTTAGVSPRFFLNGAYEPLRREAVKAFQRLAPGGVARPVDGDYASGEQVERLGDDVGAVGLGADVEGGAEAVLDEEKVAGFRFDEVAVP